MFKFVIPLFLCFVYYFLEEIFDIQLSDCSLSLKKLTLDVKIFFFFAVNCIGENIINTNNKKNAIASVLIQGSDRYIQRIRIARN